MPPWTLLTAGVMSAPQKPAFSETSHAIVKIPSFFSSWFVRAHGACSWDGDEKGNAAAADGGAGGVGDAGLRRHTARAAAVAPGAAGVEALAAPARLLRRRGAASSPTATPGDSLVLTSSDVVGRLGRSSRVRRRETSRCGDHRRDDGQMAHRWTGERRRDSVSGSRARRAARATWAARWTCRATRASSSPCAATSAVGPMGSPRARAERHPVRRLRRLRRRRGCGRQLRHRR